MDIVQEAFIEKVPQETLEAIIDELAEERVALKACCLVNRRWIWRGRYHLFKAIRFSSVSGLKSLQNWSAVMNPNDTPATFTRYFRLSQREDAWITPKTLTQYLDHFRSFDRVETLTLSYFSCDAFDQASLLSLFQGQIPSVRKLRLHRPTACPTSLLRFTSIFENLRDTVIYAPCWTMASHQEDHLETPRTLRGDLHLVELDEDSDPFFFLLASQVTHYQQVVLERCALHNFRSFQSFVSNTGMSLRTLYIFVDGDPPKLSLVDCIVLESLIISVVEPEAQFRRIDSTISSIVSPYFCKFILELNPRRKFPHIHAAPMLNCVFNSISQLDRPLSVLARSAVRNYSEFLFVLLTPNALELVQGLTRLNEDGDILVGEKVVGGGHVCVYIPASTPLRKALDGEAGTPCDVYDFI